MTHPVRTGNVLTSQMLPGLISVVGGIAVVRVWAGRPAVQDLHVVFGNVNVREETTRSAAWFTAIVMAMGVAFAVTEASDDQKKFVENMMIANLAEIQLGEMAQSQASSPAVRSFGEMMVTDHTRANHELRPIAEQLGVKEPKGLDMKHAATANLLSRLKGANFDREFMKAIVDAHQSVAKETRSMVRSTSSSARRSREATGTSGSASGGRAPVGASGASSDSRDVTDAGSAEEPQSVSGYAAETLPMIEEHLRRAQELLRSAGK